MDTLLFLLNLMTDCEARTIGIKILPHTDKKGPLHQYEAKLELKCVFRNE